jgi:aspartate carbamoyltransferase catalytic subunit
VSATPSKKASADVIIMLRLQNERACPVQALPSSQSFQEFCLTVEKPDGAKPTPS